MKIDLMQITREGITLANRNLDLFLFMMVFSLQAFLDFFLSNPAFSRISSILSLPLVLLEVGYGLSLPLFLYMRLQKRAVSFKEIVITTLKNTKKVILPMLIMMFMIFVLLIFGLFLVIEVLRFSTTSIPTFFQNINNWRFVFAIISPMFVIFEFSSIYFSLENQGFFKSIKSSVLTASKNLGYISTLALIDLVIYSLGAFVPIEFKLGILVVSLVNFYTAFLMISVSLIYYLKVIKKN